MISVKLGLRKLMNPNFQARWQKLDPDLSLNYIQSFRNEFYNYNMHYSPCPFAHESN